MSIDDMFKNEEKKIRKLFDTKLLSELLLLNYQYSNNEYLGTTAEDVYNSLSKKIKYTKKRKRANSKKCYFTFKYRTWN